MKIFTLLFCLSLVLAACGFTPLYGGGQGAGTPAAEGLDRVQIAMIPNAEGVALRNHLIDRFYQGGYPQDPAFDLSFTPLIESESDLDITRESEATRKQLRLTTTLTLKDRATGETVLTRALSAQASYNVLGSQFATRVTETDAREAAIADLARQAETQVALFFTDKRF